MADLPKHGLINLYKRRGETPLQALDRLRADYPEYKDAVLSYAGRLDPLASGVLLVMTGDANKNRDEHLGLSKEYEVEILFGVSTDTYDVLGLIVDTAKKEQFKQYENSLSEAVKDSFKKIISEGELSYPPYSSRPVNGKPLFEWAREGRLSEIEIPKQKGKIKNIEFLGLENIRADILQVKIHSMIKSVSGDFRQDQIMKGWDNYFSMLDATASDRAARTFQVFKIRVNSESGTYMRSLANEIGKSLGLPALAFSIVRTKAGNYNIKDSLGFEEKSS